MAIRIGVNPINWSNDDLPELGGDIPLETCLAEAKQAGYEGIELGNKFPRRADALRPILTRHGLALVSGWYSLRLLERSAADEIAAMRDHFTLLKALGAPVMIVAEVTGAVHGERGTPASRRPVLNEKEWGRFGERLTEVGDFLAREGMPLVYHHHMGTVVQSGDDVRQLMEVTGPSVHLLLDTGHLTYAGADPLEVAKHNVARIGHVHCKDVRRPVLDESRRGDRSFLDSVVAGVFTVPGDGCVDFEGVLSVLRAHGYRGWVVVEAEQDPAKAHPLTYAKLGYKNLRRLIDQAGF